MYYMRAVVNISLPQNLNEILEKEVLQGNFSSKSEFFRSLLRNYLETKTAKELEESRRELKSGNGKLLRSLSDLT